MSVLEAGGSEPSPGGQRRHSVSMLLVLVVGGVVGGERRSVHAGVVKSTVAFISADSLHHEMATHRSLGHV